MSTKLDKLHLRLAAELEREIFEVAAHQYAGDIPRLMLVARRVEIWVKPLLYRAFNIGRLKQKMFLNAGAPPSIDWTSFLPVLESRPDVFHAHCRHLFIDDWPPIHINLVLKKLGHIQNLFLFSRDYDPTLLPALEAMPPLRLTVNPQALFHPTVVDFAHPAFARITHLHLRWSHPDTWAPWESLAALPCLTHLAFSVLRPVLFTAALAHCAHLKVLVYMLSLLYDEDVSNFAHEARFVPMLVHHIWREWEAEATGREDFWDRADTIVRERQSPESDNISLTRIPRTIQFALLPRHSHFAPT